MTRKTAQRGPATGAGARADFERLYRANVEAAVSLRGHISAQGSENVKDGSITVNVRGVLAGDIVVLAAQTTAQGSEMATRLTSPPAPSCVSLPTPPAPALSRSS